MEETDIYKLLKFLRNNHYLQNTTPNIEIVKHYYKDSVKKTIEDRKGLFRTRLVVYLSDYSESFLNDFFEYWSEHGERDKKMRFEKETSFDISRRLKTWKRNQDKFNKQPSTQTNKVNDKWL